MQNISVEFHSIHIVFVRVCGRYRKNMAPTWNPVPYVSEREEAILFK